MVAIDAVVIASLLDDAAAAAAAAAPSSGIGLRINRDRSFFAIMSAFQWRDASSFVALSKLNVLPLSLFSKTSHTVS